MDANSTNSLIGTLITGISQILNSGITKTLVILASLIAIAVLYGYIGYLLGWKGGKKSAFYMSPEDIAKYKKDWAEIGKKKDNFKWIEDEKGGRHGFTNYN
jgi:hypothetical protein